MVQVICILLYRQIETHIVSEKPVWLLDMHFLRQAMLGSKQTLEKSQTTCVVNLRVNISYFTSGIQKRQYAISIYTFDQEYNT